MCKNIILAVGITILFLGLAIQPSIATVQPEKIDVEPDVEGLVTQLRVVINEILQDYGYIPKIKTICNIILNKTDSFWGVLLYFYLIIILEALLTIPFLMLDEIIHVERLYEIVFVIVKYLLFILMLPLIAILMIPFILFIFPLIWD